MRHSILSAVSVVALAVGAGHSWAVEPKGPSQADLAKAAEMARQKALQQFDLNRDGVLSDQERNAAEQAAMQSAMSVPMSPGMPVGSSPFLKQFDRDRDGRLSATEIRLAREMAERMRRTASGGGGPQRGFTPGGGAPAPAAPPAEAKPEKVSPLVKRFDKDGDGKLNDEEKAAAQADLNKGKKKDKAEKP